MPVSKHYMWATFVPSCVAFLSSVVFSLLDNRDYQSEWITGYSFIALQAFISLGVCVIFCVSALPIFFNKLPFVRRCGLLNWLSWFLLPTIWVFILAKNFYKIEREPSEVIYGWLLVLPFVLGLLASFISFCAVNKAK